MITTLVSKAFEPEVVQGLAEEFPTVRFVRLNADWSVPDDARDAEILIRIEGVAPPTVWVGGHTQTVVDGTLAWP